MRPKMRERFSGNSWRNRRRPSFISVAKIGARDRDKRIARAKSPFAASPRLNP